MTLSSDAVATFAPKSPSTCRTAFPVLSEKTRLPGAQQSDLQLSALECCPSQCWIDIKGELDNSHNFCALTTGFCWLTWI
jgi:hypothetical protein